MFSGQGNFIREAYREWLQAKEDETQVLVNEIKDRLDAKDAAQERIRGLEAQLASQTKMAQEYFRRYKNTADRLKVVKDLYTDQVGENALYKEVLKDYRREEERLTLLIGDKWMSRR